MSVEEKKDWAAVSWTGWREDPNVPGRFHGQFVGERNDGGFFYANALQRSLDEVKNEARLSLDRFLEG